MASVTLFQPYGAFCAASVHLSDIVLHPDCDAYKNRNTQVYFDELGLCKKQNGTSCGVCTMSGNIYFSDQKPAQADQIIQLAILDGPIVVEQWG